MTPISQRAPAWKSNELGTCPNDTFGSSGCKLFALASMYDRDPNELNEQFILDGVYQNGCLISDELAAKSLGVEFDGKTTAMPTYMTIAETDNFKSAGVPQHFFVWLGVGNQIMDPLDGTIKTNKYHIVSFRLFKERTTMTADQVYFIIEPVWRRLNKGYPVPNKTAMMADAQNIADNYSKWAMDALIQKWITGAKIMYKEDCKTVATCPPPVVCPPCNCTVEVKAEQDRIINNLVK